VQAQHLVAGMLLAIQNISVEMPMNVTGLRFRQYGEIDRTPFL
jgi:hypothetical protein